MKRIARWLIVAILAFCVGLACADLFRLLTSNQEETILADEVLPQDDLYREVVLRGELMRLRRLIDQYASDHAGGLRPRTYPRSLNDLVREGYLPEIPVDPITGERDWQADGLVCLTSGQPLAVFGVHSKSSEISSEGTPYNEW